MIWLRIICSIILAYYALEPILNRFHLENTNLDFDSIWYLLNGLPNQLILYLATIAFIACQFRPLQSTIFQILIPIVIFDTAYQLAPLNLQPIPIRSIFKWKTADTVIRLEEQPFFVFQPNTIITSGGKRGDEFTKSWMSDSLGFKNINQDNTFDWAAIGDSFTEGMGLPTEESWPNVLNSRGIPTYNLGVQGYAPSQSVATLNYANKRGIKFKGIIVGYLPTIYNREAELSQGKPSKPIGGMKITELTAQHLAVFRSHMLSKEIFKAAIKITSAKLRKKKPKIIHTSHTIPSHYLEDINKLHLHEMLDESLEKNANYITMLNTYAKAIKQAHSKQKEIFFVIFPHRQDLFGHILYKNTDYFCNTDLTVEYNIIKPWLAEKGVTILDLSLPIYKKVEAWYLNPEKNQMPYFNFDGHFNSIGNEIVADTVEAFIKNGKKPKSMIENLCSSVTKPKNS